jgi:hypothetical protein
MRFRLLAVLAALLGAHAAAAATAGAAAGPCGVATGATYRHVLWVVMENHDVAQTIGSPEAPVLNALARGCASAGDHHGLGHPSLPNYVTLMTGSRHGITSDCLPAVCAFHGQSLLAQAWALPGRSRVYAESMPSPCYPRNAGLYLARHNPAVYLKSLGSARCRQIAVPLGPPATGPLGRALATATLPAFAIVVPNRCNDMHNCPVATGDAWLGRLVRQIVTSPAWRRRDTALLITWDEDEGSGDDPIGLIAIAPSVRRGTVVRRRTDHYAVLRLTEDLLGLPLLGAARTAADLRGVLRMG